jgi:hypothetical protein
MTYRTADQARRDAAAIAGVVDGADTPELDARRDHAAAWVASHAKTIAVQFGVPSRFQCLSDYERNRQAQHLLMAAYGTIEKGALGEALIALARTDPSDHEAMADAYDAIREAAADAMNAENNRMMEGF